MNRSECESVMQQAAATLEQRHTARNSYLTTGSAHDGSLPKRCGEKQQTYGVTYSIASTGLSFTIKATPAGRQVNDRCGSLQLTNQGVKSAQNGTVESCWR
ncbi:MAG: hypothetical protein LBO00_05985 [Zoogloeaceae bacterium]|nr:hypothetical protein [Zoogloeaceae bacterium]